ncbi:MAG: TetR/AcrR family transcriptional regulator [Promethearchaeota archaeon]|nr:MAG: TetR/AcrR family transcriptional regulator [Candidatus Lokiarchaeota archaeon]
MTITPFQKQKQIERDLIIEIGGNLFLSKGFQGFSLRLLTEKLNMPKSNFYTHFQSKRELFYAFKIQEYQKFHEKFHALVESQICVILEKLTRLMRFYMNYAAQDFHRFQLIFATQAPPFEKFGPIEQEFNAQPNIMIAELVRIIQSAISNGEIKPINPLHCTYFLWAIMYGNIQTIDRIKSGRLGDYLAYENYAIEEMRNYLKTLLVTTE